METSAARTKINVAFQMYLHETGYTIDDPDRLADFLLEVFGFAEQVKYNGWTLVRMVGSEMKKGLRGDARYRYGWRATYDATGDVRDFEPSSGHDVPLELTYGTLDLLNKIHAKYGSFKIPD